MPAEPTTTFAALRWLIMYLYSRRGLPSNVDALRDLLSHRPRLLRQRWRRAHTTFHRVPLSARGRRPLNILCLDGGGMRGVAQLAMVEEMEELTGKPVSELFDLVVGTSIGGCGALFVSCFPRKGSAPKMARRALRELQTRCFARTSALRLLWQGQYAADDRRQFMIELCGYRRIHGGFWIPKWRGPRVDQFWRLQPRVKNVSPMEADETKLSRLEEHVRGQFAGWEHAKEMCATLAASRADPLSNLRDLCFELVWTAQWAYDRRLRWAHSYAPVLLAWPMYALTVAKRLAVALLWYLRAAIRNAYAGALYALRRTPLVREVHRLGYALLAALLSAVASAARALAALFFRLSSTDLLDGQTDDLLA